jgi:molybdopterin synthase catalytic subunit
MILLTHSPIDTAELLARSTHAEAGAVVLFLGTTRELTAGRQTVVLSYEAYQEMAERRLAELEAEARRRWPVIECNIVHRLGTVPPTEASVAIAVSTPHRADAFAAGQWLIDSLKADVPIWKREQWADGTTEWVHPGIKAEGESGRGGDGETPTHTANESPPLPLSPSPPL